ncbi:hypothetical protein CPB86DRAFT_793511 [Serendipita vermifera]|nr:hypothetical protein CPB86DRAFT_793511 [Serendipita vermifera]
MSQYSARGGPRSKGADVTARNNASSPPPTTLETPLPRSTVTHYNRGGKGNEWDHIVEDGAVKEALVHDQMRVLELGLGHRNKPAVAGLRGGARIPKPKDPSIQKESKHLHLLRRRAFSLTGSDRSAPNDHPSISGNSVQQRAYEPSFISTDTGQSAYLSNFTVPSFVRDQEDPVLTCSSTESLSSNTEQQRLRSFSRTLEDPVHIPKGSPLEPHGKITPP